jgi:hypothetical protein
VVTDSFDQFGDGDEHPKGYAADGRFVVLELGGEALSALEVRMEHEFAGSISEDLWGVVLEVDGD